MKPIDILVEKRNSILKFMEFYGNAIKSCEKRVGELVTERAYELSALEELENAIEKLSK